MPRAVARAERAFPPAALRSCRLPRGYPDGVGTGESLEWGIGRRLLLLIEADELRAALPAFYRNACGSTGRSVSPPGAWRERFYPYDGPYGDPRDKTPHKALREKLRW